MFVFEVIQGRSLANKISGKKQVGYKRGRWRAVGFASELMHPGPTARLDMAALGDKGNVLVNTKRYGSGHSLFLAYASYDL